MVSILCNPGIRSRHWEQMSAIVYYDLTPNSGTTLRKVLRLNLNPYLEQFEAISAGASKVRPAWGWGWGGVRGTALSRVHTGISSSTLLKPIN